MVAQGAPAVGCWRALACGLVQPGRSVGHVVHVIGGLVDSGCRAGGHLDLGAQATGALPQQLAPGCFTGSWLSQQLAALGHSSRAAAAQRRRSSIKARVPPLTLVRIAVRISAFVLAGKRVQLLGVAQRLAGIGRVCSSQRGVGAAHRPPPRSPAFWPCPGLAWLLQVLALMAGGGDSTSQRAAPTSPHDTRHTGTTHRWL